MKCHELKTDHEVFQATLEGRKPWEIRFDDRGFQIGDTLWLRETESTGEDMRVLGRPLVYTGRFIHVRITYILQGPIYGLPDGWVVMSVL